MKRSFRFLQARCLKTGAAFAGALLLAACAGTRSENTPRLNPESFDTIVFVHKRVETGRLDTKPAIQEFIGRLNAARADSGGAVKPLCIVSLRGSEGTQRMRAQANRFSLSGAGCRFGQSHCRYKGDFDVEAFCRAGGR